jgi:monoamine oxidase
MIYFLYISASHTAVYGMLISSRARAYRTTTEIHLALQHIKYKNCIYYIAIYQQNIIIPYIEPHPQNMEVEIAIIGAGISGLSAARLLAKNGFHNYKIFEANDRVGGRTLVDGDGTDLGGAYFGPTQDRILAVIDDCNLQLKKVNTKGKTVQFIDGKCEHYDGTIPPVSILGALDLNAAMNKIDNLCARINLKDPHLSENSEYLDSITGEEFLRSNIWTRDARAILRTGIRAILCVEPCQLSVSVCAIKDSIP